MRLNAFYNRYLISTFLAGAVLCVPHTPSAQAKDSLFKPRGEWSISKIDRTAQGGNSYCTLSRPFENNAVVSLGYNVTEEFSVAIDFQKPVFDTEKSLKIELQPGPGQMRAYDMMPISERAVVVRLGWDNGFLNALKSSQALKAKIDDKEYAFAMPNLEEGKQDLTACVEGMKAASRGAGGTGSKDTSDVLQAKAGSADGFDATKSKDQASVASRDASSASQEVAAQKQKVEQEEKSLLASFADSIRAQEPSLQHDEKPARRNFGRSAKEEDIAEKPVAELSTAGGAAPEKMEPAAEPVPQKAVKTSASVSPDAPPSAEKVAQASGKNEKLLMDQIAALRQENAQLKATLEKGTEAQSVQDENLDQQLAVLQADKKMLQEKVKRLEDKEKQAQSEDLQALSEQVKTLEAKNAQLEESLRQSQTRIAETAVNVESKASKRIAELEMSLEAAKTDNIALAKQIDQYKLQKEDGRLSLVAGDWDLEQATKRFNEAEREIRRLGLQLEQERTNCNREKAQIEQMLFDPAVADKKQIQKLTELEMELKAAREQLAGKGISVEDAGQAKVAAVQRDHEAEIKAMEERLSSLQIALSEKEAQSVQLQKTLQDEMANLRAQVAEKDQKLASLQNVKAVDPKDVDARVQAALEKERTESAARMASVLKEKEALQAAVDANQNALNAAQKALAAPKADPEAQERLVNLEKAVSDLERTNALLRDQNLVLKQDADKLKLQIADVQSNGAARADRVASAQLQAEDLRRQLAMKERQNVTYQNQIAALQQESAQLKSRLNVSDSSRVSSTQDVSALTRQIQALQRQIADMERERAARPVQASASDIYDSITPMAGTVQPAVMNPSQNAPSVTRSKSSAGKPPIATGPAGYDAKAIESLLRQSGLRLSAGVQKVSTGLTGADNFNWTDSSNVRGMASVQAMAGSGFDALVSRYIEYQKSLCKGDFASMPSPSNAAGAKKMVMYEVACVSSADSQSFSLLFFEDQGRFIAISSQMPASDMDIAMDARDRIAGFVRNL